MADSGIFLVEVQLWWDIRVLGICWEATLGIAFILFLQVLTYAQPSIKLHPENTFILISEWYEAWAVFHFLPD